MGSKAKRARTTRPVKSIGGNSAQPTAADPLLPSQALQSYQQALERNKENKQLAEKVRVLQKVVRSKAAAAQR